MIANRSARLFGLVDAYEQRLCRRLNRAVRGPKARDLFVIVSRLGDGLAWYLLLLLLPVWYGTAGLKSALLMAVTGIAGVGLYKALKQRLVRERPYITFAGIDAATPPLDRYSFPSGHTMHAVAFTVLATASFPELGWTLVPFATLISASRVVLGLHYPTDVLAGAMLGTALAGVALALS